MARRILYNPKSSEPFKLSRSKIDLFIKCPRTFYLDRRLGISPPTGPAFTLNSAVDALLKKEFDHYRETQKPHPLMEQYRIDAVPFQHGDMDVWRNNFKGVQYLHKPTNLLIFGAVDDLWLNKKGELHVVDYKSTSTSTEITLNVPTKEPFKRQAEIYQWLLRQNGFMVNDRAYFVYANGLKTPSAFNATLNFDMQIIPYDGDDSWVEKTIMNIKKCLDSPNPPPWGKDSEWGPYVEAAGAAAHE